MAVRRFVMVEEDPLVIPKFISIWINQVLVHAATVVYALSKHPITIKLDRGIDLNSNPKAFDCTASFIAASLYKP